MMHGTMNVKIVYSNYKVITESKVAVTPLYVITVRFEFRIKQFSAKVSSTRSNKIILNSTYEKPEAASAALCS
jgi:hypothetical protein